MSTSAPEMLPMDECLAGLSQTSHALQDSGSKREFLEHTKRFDLVRLVQQPVPLVSYAAAEVIKCVLHSHYLTADEAQEWMHALLSLEEEAPRASVVNTLECCRSLVAGWCEELHPELSQGESTGNKAVKDPAPEVALQAVAVLWQAIPDLLGLARQHLQARGSGLPMVWLLKLLVALTQPELPPHLRCLCLGHVGALVTVLGVWAEVESVQEARRQMLLLALQLLRDDDGLMGTPEHAGPLLHALPPLLQGDGVMAREEEEGGEGACHTRGCAFIRPTTAADLLPYQLTLLCKALRACLSVEEMNVSRLSSPQPHLLSPPRSDRSPHLPVLQALLACQLSRGLLRTSPDHSPFVSILSEHDDLLLESLNDWLVVAALLRGNGLPWAGPLLRESGPLSMLCAFLCTLAWDEGVLLDMLLSGDTCILEYLIRLTKYITAVLRPPAAGSVPPLDHRRWADLSEGEREAILCILRLGVKVEGHCAKNLFPYDARPWLNRVAECRAVCERAMCT